MMTKDIMISVIAYNQNLSALAFPTQADPFSTIGHSFLHDLAREGDVLSAEIIHNTGSAIDLPNDEGRRPLHEAAFHGHLDMVAFLLDNGARIDAPIHPLGHTALTLAVQQGHHAIVKYLLKKGADIHVADNLLGSGLLHLAAARGDAHMAGLLISHGVDIFHEDRKGRTARDIAAQSRNPMLEKTLLKVMEHHARYRA